MSIIRTAVSLSFVALAASLVACSTGSDDSATGNQAVNAGTCDPAGTWAIKVETPVSWANSFVVQGGTGTIVNWLKTTRTADGLNVVDTASLCGVSTPDYHSTATFGNEQYGLTFPESLFEDGVLPTFDIAGTLSGTDVGSSFQAQPAAAVLGATLANPATDAWPTNGAQIVSADMDSDSKPGVTLLSSTGGTYKNPPLDAFQSARAGKIYATFRQVLTTQGTITTCDRIDGSGTVAVINNKPAIDSHVLGCQHDNGTTECSASEYKLLDSAAPVYKPTGDAVVTIVRVDPTASCSDIRALDFTATR